MFVSGTTTIAQQGTGTGIHFQNFVVKFATYFIFYCPTFRIGLFVMRYLQVLTLILNYQDFLYSYVVFFCFYDI